MLAAVLAGGVWLVVAPLSAVAIDRSSVIPGPVNVPEITPSPTPTPTPTVPAEPTSYKVATLSGAVDRYDQPDGKKVGTVPGDWYGYASILPVIDEADGWLKVRLQRRPNEDTAWIKADGVKLSTTPYRITVDVKEQEMTLYQDGQKVFSAPVGVGKKATPTPTGSFFVTFQHKPPSAGYGPVMLFLSAHSETIQNFQGSGDAIIAFHGPVGSDAKIGTDGAALSNGCIRMHPEDLAKLKPVLPGSPVDIF